MQRLLQRHIKPGTRVLEIGCAPGKLLAWGAKARGAKVAGIDYSEIGIAHARKLFNAIGCVGDLRYEDVFASTFPDSAFDLVYSLGVIEHFQDPRDIVARHIRFAVPGGRIVIVIPNYGGIYGRLQRYFDPDNLSIHNLHIMNRTTLRQLVPVKECKDVRAFCFGRVSPWLVNFHKRWPRIFAQIASLSLNGLGLLQPTAISSLAPFLVLDGVRKA
jgi:2-polyprenyl-3-methyl-5-hydroxy-6-metoxy-1,4-benzoquinol methylase